MALLCVSCSLWNSGEGAGACACHGDDRGTFSDTFLPGCSLFQSGTVESIEFGDIGYLLEASECVSWIFAPYFASCSLDNYQVILQIVDGACSNFLVAFILKFSLFLCSIVILG